MKVRFQRLQVCLTLAVLICLVSMGPAAAGNFAERAIIGFSSDGRYFAFEQFGVNDGSGFPYSEIFVIDLVADEWVSGTPVRITLESESASVANARDIARGSVQSTLNQLLIRHPGRLLASAPPTEIPQSTHELSFRRYPFETATDTIHTIRVGILDLPPPDGCEGLDVDIKGFSLQVLNMAAETAVSAHVDSSVPKSRGCPLDYGISDIIAYPAFNGTEVIVALVNVFSYGFEGSDRRFLAIKLPVP